MRAHITMARAVTTETRCPNPRRLKLRTKGVMIRLKNMASVMGMSTSRAK